MLKESATEYKDSTVDEMIEATHLETLPWHLVFEDEKRRQAEIPYEYVLRPDGAELMEHASGKQRDIRELEMNPGTILTDTQFLYSDGTTGNKILIVLNDGEVGHYIVIKITSKDKYKSLIYGCQSDDRYPNFYLPKALSSTVVAR
ncbi:MAG TPA: hypothetical protein VGO68_03080 [Pyrinomonadaceae bacterium]|nr:hypothetical protein [Pyrinomonadaceae bacterium]